MVQRENGSNRRGQTIKRVVSLPIGGLDPTVQFRQRLLYVIGAHHQVRLIHRRRPHVAAACFSSPARAALAPLPSEAYAIIRFLLTTDHCSSRSTRSRPNRPIRNRNSVSSIS